MGNFKCRHNWHSKSSSCQQNGQFVEVDAIASRDIAKSNDAADLLNINKRYGSYEELLKDPEIDAIYIPLPYHLHVLRAIKAMEAGKHVLCEKPIGMSAVEAQFLLPSSQKYPDLKVMEVFMCCFHPQWQKIIDAVFESSKKGQWINL